MDTTAQIVIDSASTVAMINAKARAVFGLSSNDVGRPLQDLEISYRPVELRSLIDQVFGSRTAVTRQDAGWTVNDHAYGLEVQVLPMVDPTGSLLGAKIQFVDVTACKRLQWEVQRSDEMPAENSVSS